MKRIGIAFALLILSVERCLPVENELIALEGNSTSPFQIMENSESSDSSFKTSFSISSQQLLMESRESSDNSLKISFSASSRQVLDKENPLQNSEEEDTNNLSLNDPSLQKAIDQISQFNEYYNSLRKTQEISSKVSSLLPPTSTERNKIPVLMSYESLLKTMEEGRFLSEERFKNCTQIIATDTPPPIDQIGKNLNRIELISYREEALQEEREEALRAEREQALRTEIEEAVRAEIEEGFITEKSEIDSSIENLPPRYQACLICLRGVGKCVKSSWKKSLGFMFGAVVMFALIPILKDFTKDDSSSQT
jgi:hypothetical protein